MVNKKDICIVIPIYKEYLNDFEIQSVEQCGKVLSNYSHCFVAPKGLNIDFYIKRFPSIVNFLYFDQSFFIDIAGYNRLMLSVIFYKAFENYKYMLVYQTDCYVFRDELLTWANKGCDYIGGIWFENYTGDPYLGAKFLYPGNGGLSLRKIKSIIGMLSSKKPIKKWGELFIETKRLRNKGRISFVKGFFLFPLYVFGYKNNINYNSKKYQFNEDAFIIQTSLKLKSFKIPNAEEAIGFSWDRHPKYLFTLTGNLPFGCHAWYREDELYKGNREFWLEKISKKCSYE